MAKSENQKIKILYLAKMFQEETDEHNGLKLEQIISKLEKEGIKAERKSLYSDINALRDFGIDVQMEKGKDGTKYFTADREFEIPELKLLVDAVQGSKFITKKKSEKLIKKIESLASIHQAKELQRQVYVSNRIKTMNESIYYTVDDIHRAINRNNKISFQYYKWNANKEKELKRDAKIYIESPWALTWDDENYYLVCYDSQDEIIKHFRVDKMLRLRILDERREGEDYFKNFDMATYSRKTFGMYGGKEYAVILVCENEMADPIIDRFGQDVIIAKEDENHFKVSVRVNVSPLFLSWIVNFGGKIKIEGPKEVKEQYKELLMKAMIDI